MASRTCRSCQARDPERNRAEAILAQGRQVARDLLERGGRSAQSVPAEEESMNRYIHPIPQAFPACAGRGSQVCLERVLEALACQNQILTDLLGAVNALTAATLSVQNRLPL